MKRFLVYAAVLSCLAVAGVGCQSHSPVMVYSDFESPSAQAQVVARPAEASAETFRLGAGDALGTQVFDRYVAWVHSGQSTPWGLQLADASAPYVLERADRYDEQRSVLQTSATPLFPF